MYCIIDIDTTIANNEHRASKLVKNPDGSISQESWDAFLHPELMALDTPQQHALDVLSFMRKTKTIVFLTGRNEKYREVTTSWLQTHMGMLEGELLLMRPLEERGTPASDMKKRIYLEFIGLSKVECLFFEDDPHVLPMWKEFGLVFKCPEAWAVMNPETPQVPEKSWTR